VEWLLSELLFVNIFSIMSDRAEGIPYAMDEFGNITARTQTAGGGGNLPQSMALAVSAATNRLAGADYTYDVLGNLVQMPAPDGLNSLFMTYLDQGHIGTLTDAAGVVWKYYYDADGKRRIKVKTAGGAATEPDGQGGVRLVADRSFFFYESEDLICQQDVGDMEPPPPGRAGGAPGD
jgi:YD repeat-containing protein